MDAARITSAMQVPRVECILGLRYYMLVYHLILLDLSITLLVDSSFIHSRHE